MSLITRGLGAKTLITRGLGFLKKIIPSIDLFDRYCLYELPLDFSIAFKGLEHRLVAIALEFNILEAIPDFSTNIMPIDFELHERKVCFKWIREGLTFQYKLTVNE